MHQSTCENFENMVSGLRRSDCKPWQHNKQSTTFSVI